MTPDEAELAEKLAANEAELRAALEELERLDIVFTNLLQLSPATLGDGMRVKARIERDRIRAVIARFRTTWGMP
jgi:hypothetical protein